VLSPHQKPTTFSWKPPLITPNGVSKVGTSHHAIRPSNDPLAIQLLTPLA